jgi:ADP-ribose pyrophosphatase YjhB (NUDIX family)
MAGTGEQWLAWAREIQAIAQTGLHFTTNEFDRQRYTRLAEISAEIFAGYTNGSMDELVPIFLAQTGYATPKVDVRGAVIRDGQLLMVREKVDGNWSMPGGWADVNEAPSTVVEREVWEESGYRVKAQRLLGVYEANHDVAPVQVFHAYKLVFLCDLLGGDATPSIETTDVAFYSPADIPELSTQRTPPRVIERVFAHYADKSLPVDFD